MAYSEQTWVNGSLGGTPISAGRLTHAESGISSAATTADTALELVTAVGDDVTRPRVLYWTGTGWPDRPDDDRATIFIGGTAPDDAPDDADLRDNDTWFPAESPVVVSLDWDNLTNVPPVVAAGATQGVAMGELGITSFAQGLITTVTDEATTRSAIGAQPLDTDLTAIAGLTSAANKLPYATGAGAWAMTDLTSQARTFLASADGSSARTVIDTPSTEQLFTTGSRASVFDLKIRGGNITVKPGYDWKFLFAEWDWDNWIKPQIDRAVLLGMNTVRLIGDPGVVTGSAAPPVWAAWQSLHTYTSSDLDRLKSNGGNAYLLIQAGTSAASGGPTGTGASITDGTCVWKYMRPNNLTLISQADYDARWIQLVKYCATLGLFVYPCLCETKGFDSTPGAGYQDATVTASITTTAAKLAKYPNVIGYDLFQEADVRTGRPWAPNTAYSVGSYVNNGGKSYQVATSGTSASSGPGPTGTGSGIVDNTVTWNYIAVPLFAADVLALMAAVRAVCNVRLTCSSGYNGSQNWWVTEPQNFVNYQVNVDPAGSDFIDVHLYNRASGGSWTFSTEGVLDYADSIGKPLLIGEFGAGQDISGSEQVAQYTDIAAIHAKPGIMGSLTWALADQGIVTNQRLYGMWDNTGWSVAGTPLSTTSGQRSGVVSEFRKFVASEVVPAFRLTGKELQLNSTLTGASGTETALSVPITVNQSGTAQYNGVHFQVTHTSLGSGGSYYPLRLSVGGVTKFSIDSNGQTRLRNLFDSNNNKILELAGQTNAVNYFNIWNGPAGIGPQLLAEGSDTNITMYLVPKGTGPLSIVAGAGVTPRLIVSGADANINFNLVSKGTGVVQANGVEIVTLTGTQQLSNKTFSNSATLAEAANLVTGTTTGSKIGTATTQKLGFWNATPVVQPTAVADATNGTNVITQLNALLSRLRTIGLVAP